MKIHRLATKKAEFLHLKKNRWDVPKSVEKQRFRMCSNTATGLTLKGLTC